MNWMEAYWHWRPRLVEALDDRYFTGEWLDVQVMSGRALFLHSDHSAVVAEIRFYPTGNRDVVVICGAGDAVKMRDTFIPALEEIGRRNGCLAVLVDSREAWARLLKPMDFEPYKVTVRKAL